MAHDTMSGGDRQHQQTGQYRMYTCRDCGAAFASRKGKRGRRVLFCPECIKEHRREKDRLHMARKQSQTAHEAMLARLAARDAEYERGNHVPEVVRVSNGLRIETRGRVCGSPVGAARRIA